MESQEMTTDSEYEASQLFEKAFETHEELIRDTKSFYLRQGYVVAIKKSKKDKFAQIGCDRGGVYRNRRNIPLELRKRKTSSRLMNCPFQVVARKQVNGPWKLHLINDSHNHAASTDMSGHPSCRHLSKEEIQTVEEMASSGIPPRQILSSLRQKNPALQAINRTIYNMIHKIREEKLGGRTMIQALFEELGQGNFFYNIKHDENGRLSHLFFAHPTSITLSRTFPHVFVMDCTYKTNRYKMPLLEIVGVSCFHTSFFSCFAFMERERGEDYVWALEMFRKVLGPNCQPGVIISDRELALMNAIQIVFPSAANLLCVWHIEKNILAHGRRHFDSKEDWDAFMSSWNEMLRSPNEHDFGKNWRLFEESHKEKREVVAYIQQTWLPYKERFVNAWTEKFPHFGHRVSSRAEGAHAKIKKYLQVSTGDFRQVKEKICLAIANEFQEIKTRLSTEKISVPHSLNTAFFKEIVRKVSVYAMKELHKQYEMAKYGTMSSSCTGHFMSTMGLPCAHKIATTCKDGVIPLSFIHSHWKLVPLILCDTSGPTINENEAFKELLNDFQDKFEQWPLALKEKACDTISELVSTQVNSLSEPKVPPPKSSSVRSNKRKASSSTKRDPSRFEIEEKRRKCSSCKSVEHDIRTCPNKNKVSGQISYCFPNVLDDRGSRVIDLNVEPDFE